MPRTEHDEQSAFVTWFRFQYKKWAMLCYSIPNGSHLAGSPKDRAIKMRKMKEEGLLSGAQDINIDVPCGQYHGLRIEFKRANGVPSDWSKEQRAVGEAQNEAGYKYVVCFGFDDAKKAIIDYLGEKG